MGGGSATVAPKKKSQVSSLFLCPCASRHFPRCTVTCLTFPALPAFLSHGPSPSRAQEPTTDWKLLFWVMATPFVLLVVVRTPPISESMLARSCTKLCNVARASHSRTRLRQKRSAIEAKETYCRGKRDHAWTRAYTINVVYSICLWIYREPIAETPCQGICEITDKLLASSPPGAPLQKK